MPSRAVPDAKSIKSLQKKTDKLLGRKTPKTEHTTTGIIMDSRDLATLRKCAQLRVIRGETDRASVSDLVREAVREYIERHELSAQEYFFDNMARMSAEPGQGH